MKAKEILNKYKITRNTLRNWVKGNLITYTKTPSGRYIYGLKLDKYSIRDPKITQFKDQIEKIKSICDVILNNENT